MNQCWNCHAACSEETSFCSTCGCPSHPSIEALPVLQESVRYLLREVRRWNWLPPERQANLLWEYRERESRLGLLLEYREREAGLGGARAAPSVQGPAAVPQAPGDAPPVPGTPPQPMPLSPVAPPPAVGIPPAGIPPAPSAPPGLGPVPSAPPGLGPVPAPPSPGIPPAPAPFGAPPAPASTPGILEEGNIRWFFSLGGLLLLAGGIGLLGSQWGRVGTFAVTLGLLLAPVASFGGAWWLRSSLPISSRLLSVLGGLLLPTGLLAVRFLAGIGGSISDAAWTAGTFSFSAVVLLALCLVLAEAACLWLGTLSLLLALGSLATWLSAGPWVFGLGSMLAAFGWLALSRLPSQGWYAEALDAVRPHLFPASQVLALMGMLSTLPGWTQRTGDAPILFFMGASFFATAGLVSNRPGVLYVAGLLGACFAGLGVWWVSAPFVYAAYAFLAMGTAWLVVARVRTEDPAVGEASYLLGTGMTGLALVCLFGCDLLRILVGGLAGLPASHLVGTVGAALLATAFYAVSAVLWQRPALVYGSTMALAYAGLVAVVGLDRVDFSLVALYLAGFPLAVLVLLMVAERSLPALFARPMVDVALALSFISGPLAIALRVHDPSARGMSALTVGVLVAFYVLLLRFRRSPGWLYSCLLWALVDLALLKPKMGHTGLSFVPVAAILALLGENLEKRYGREWAIPCMRTAWMLTWGVLFLQPWLFVQGEPLVPLTLGLVAAGLAFFSTRLEGWNCLDHSAPDVLAHLSLLVAPAVLYTWAWSHISTAQALVLLSVLLLVEAGVACLVPAGKGTRWASSLRLSALCWAVVTIGMPRGPMGLALQWAVLVAPVVTWLLVAVTGEGITVGYASLFVVLACGWGVMDRGGFPWWGAPAAGAASLAVTSLGYGLLVRRHEAFAVPSWLLAMAAWGLGVSYLGLPEERLALHFWPFAALVAGACLYWRLAVLEILAHVTAGVVLLMALQGGAGQFAATAGAWGLACGVVCVSVRSPGYLAGATTLAPMALVALGIWLEASHESVMVALVVLSLAWLLSGALLLRGPMQGGGDWEASARHILGTQAMILVAPVACLGLGQVFCRDGEVGKATVAVLLSVAALVLQGRLSGRSAWYHWAYGASHLLVLGWLGNECTVEWVTLPLAAWLLSWSLLGERSSRASFEVMGMGIALGPSVAASVLAPYGAHALWAGVLSLAAVLLGASGRRMIVLIAGSAGLLLEALLQLHLALSGLGWQIYAFVAGVTLCGSGILIERRRRDLQALRERLVQQFSADEP